MRITGIVTYMVLRSPALAGTACVIIPVVAFVNKRYGDWLHKNAALVQTALAASNEVANETITVARTVVAYAGEDKAARAYEDKIEAHYELNVKQVIAQGAYYMFVSTFLVNTVVQSLLLAVGCYLISAHGLQVEVLLAFMLYQGQLQEYTLQIFQSYTSLLKSSGAGQKVFEMMDRTIRSPGVGSEENERLGKAALR